MSAIGIVAALREEARTLSRRARPAGAPLRLGEHAWLASPGGVGAALAVGAGERLLAVGAVALVSWGTAGALDPTLAAGDLLLPERVVDADGEEYRPDAGWRARVCTGLGELAAASADTLAQSSALAMTAQDKRLLRERLQAAAVDMESAALARLARQRGVPFLAVRVVTDTALSDIPRSVGAAIDGGGRLRLSRLLRNVCLRPGDLPALLVLARNYRAARTTLEDLAASAAAGLFIAPSPEQSPEQSTAKRGATHTCRSASGP